jgi:hypothetical protein
VRMVLHVFHAKSFGLLNARSSFGRRQRFPLFAWNTKNVFVCLMEFHFVGHQKSHINRIIVMCVQSSKHKWNISQPRFKNFFNV